ncbi:SPFH domain-containing protein [Lignipirellula cremea]|uniref:SPFH domain / Band 7 family protein n=1 Tax=Lignipirellula cremea TaxID=2528010 RepID=A0A518DU79_9BACT|nr:SPFH domain-containing protein [Lignipirellula cremea]QDU95386.1 SPFH domain / Band 7 family protein [Lignipirellula cremea]
MFGIRYLKAPPTTYIMQFRKGSVVREGAGLAFLYFAPTSVIVSLPFGSTDAPYVFNEVTADFQEATIQGQLTYRITNPARLSALLDYSLDAQGRHQSDDPGKLNDRLIQAAQILAREYTGKARLRDLLLGSDDLVKHVEAGFRSMESVAMLGVEVLGFSVLSIKGTPEMSKALQADAREKLLQQADEAIYARRNTAVELERKIRENELQTEIAVELKRRQVKETKLQADIALEQERSALVDRKVENQRKEAEAQGAALRATLEPLRETDWRTLMAASPKGFDARSLIAMGFLDLANSSGKIGQLNISPDLLQSLLQTRDPSEE